MPGLGPDILALFTQTLTIELPGTPNDLDPSADAYGEPVYQAPVTVPAWFEPTTRVTRTAEGFVTVYGTKVIVDFDTPIAPDARYTLPDGHQPQLQHIQPLYDDQGLNHYELLF